MAATRKKKGTNVAIFDIGSGSVGGALVHMAPGETPEILARTRLPITFQHDVAVARFLTLLERTTHRVAEKVVADCLKRGAHVDVVHCVFASPWYLAKTKRLTTKSEKAFTVTESYLKGLLRDARSGLDVEHAQNGDALIGKGVLMEQDILQITENGYPTGAPHNKEVNELSLTFFISSLSRDVHYHTIRALGSVFNDREVYFHSFMLAAYSVLGGVTSLEGDICIVDVSGEVTDVGLIRDGVLHETVTFPQGRNTLVRHIVREHDVTPEEALSRLRLFLAGECSEEQEQRLRAALARPAGAWHEALDEGVKRLLKTGGRPQIAYMTAEPPFGALYRDISAGGGLSAHAEGAQTKTSLFGATKLLSHAFFGRRVRMRTDMPFDPFLTIAALHINTKHYQENTSLPEGVLA